MKSANTTRNTDSSKRARRDAKTACRDARE
jgi:hypothetical protein